jgi:hypothetical protein
VSGWHWSQMEVAWLRSIVPELGNGPVYVRDFAEIPDWMQEDGARAWTSPMADLQMKKSLQARGEWLGRGHFIAVGETWRRSSLSEQRGILLHEMAHSLSAFDAMMRRDESTFGEIEAVLIAPGGLDTIRQRFELPTLDPAIGTRLSHGERWIRCCVHLASRAWEFCTLSDMVVFSEDYSLQEEHSEAVIRALMPEVRSGGNIIEILKTDPPKEFAALFHE